ncbi:3-carboxy-cis,cis-muconate cycloisomerase [Streptomyces sp. NPDC002677]|uniref:3-carboxy-cis,cis-muconate cycloisomerase n=1 Tax=Streptomyces sp. NPDC002677 TaxID=3154774 RepID=UPI0033203CAC
MTFPDSVPTDARTALDSAPDTGLLSPVRVGTPVEAAVSDPAWLQAMLDAEAALARAQAGLGTLPESAADAIGAAARAEAVDLVAIARAARETANPVVGLVRALTDVVAASDPEAAEYVHRGSTSQDVMDTAAMLVAHRALGLIHTDLLRTADALAGLALAHRDTPMAGRTLALHAVPTTFGLKAAGWRQSVLDAALRVERLRSTGLPVSLGGSAGTLAGYLEYAERDTPAPESFDTGTYTHRLVEAYARETGLAQPVLPWHALRTPIADLAGVLGTVGGVLGKLALDVQNLSRTETAEVAEPAAHGRGASSAMPHKRNPVLATLIRSAALQLPYLAAGLTGCLLAEDERSGGAWHAEWQLLRECLRLAGGAAHTAVELTEGLLVHPDRMRANLGMTGGRLVSERIVAWLAPSLGRAVARQLLDAASAEAERTGVPLDRVLAARPEVVRLLGAGRITRLMDPDAYTGAAGPLVDHALKRS